VKLEISDAQGKIVRTLSTIARPLKYPKDDADEPSEDDAKPALTTDQGLNRAVWDLRYEGARRLEHGKVDAGEPEKGLLAPPGTYTLKLIASGQTVTTTAEIKPDPHSPVPVAEIAQNVAYALRAREALNQLVDDVEAIRAIREQVTTIRRLSAADPARKDIAASADAVLARLDKLDRSFANPKAEVVYDVLAGRFGGAQLYSQIAPLYSDIGNSDYAPTQGQSEELEADLAQKAQLENDLAALRSGELSRLEQQLAAANLPRVLVPKR
jgi:hypothetical protein